MAPPARSCRGPRTWRCAPGRTEQSLVAADLERRAGRIAEKAVQRRHHLGALADRAADALHRTGADIADRKHARNRRLQYLHRTAIGRNAGDDEAMTIKRDAAIREPFSGRIGP